MAAAFSMIAGKLLVDHRQSTACYIFGAMQWILTAGVNLVAKAGGMKMFYPTSKEWKIMTRAQIHFVDQAGR